jgi:predicted O-methyltransferase YrrM
MNRSIKKFLFRIADVFFLFLNFLFLPVLRLIRRFGVSNFPLNKKLFVQKGVFPIIDHYYDPKFVYDRGFDASKKRKLAIDFREQAQLDMLNRFDHVLELKELRQDGVEGEGVFFMNNRSFSAGDAEMYYLVIRNMQPSRIIEIGSGYSTLISIAAIEKNVQEGNPVALTCIEPYEMPWLEKIGNINLVRKRVEEVPLDFFTTLEEGDILFIDSSHIIRPGNDVLFEYLEILPVLKKGVLIHIHDIFSPRHYRQEWLNDFCFWNEQYLLEAFLYGNDQFEIIGSLNYLKNDHFDEAKKAFVHLQKTHEPASFWIRKIK